MWRGLYFAVFFFGLGLAASQVALADERQFAYTYETDTLPENTFEFEQWTTLQSGKRGGDYAEWNLRSEFEYGITNDLQASIYLNLDSVRSEGVFDHEDEHDTDFKGFSTEWVYQILSPVKNPVGIALYEEYTTDGIDHELESKILFSSNIDKWTIAFNAVYEMESEKEEGQREREATLEFDAGVMRRISNGWSGGVEARQRSAYPGGFDLNGQEYQTWSVGPTLHYAGPKFWTTVSFLPQVWGKGDGAIGGRQLVHQSAREVRWIFGFNF